MVPKDLKTGSYNTGTASPFASDAFVHSPSTSSAVPSNVPQYTPRRRSSYSASLASTSHRSLFLTAIA